MRGYIGSPPADITAGIFSIDKHRKLIVQNRCIGVQDTGGRGTDGAVLRQVMLTGDVTYGHLREVSMPTSYFDAHPSYQFPDWTDASDNVFCKIPRAWWWRGNMPDVSDGTTPRWTMLLSPVPRDGFASNPGAFKRSGSWLDRFLFGKYRAFNNSGAPGSQPGKTHWDNVSWQAFKDAAAGIGEGYHMVSLQEWHEILGRAVVEKKTFQLVPKASRQNASLCKYRGIEEFAFHGTTYAEWMDGAKNNASGKYELWTEAGGDYSSTGVTCPQDSASEATYYNQGLITGTLFDHMFLGSSLGPSSTSFIPNYSGRNSGVVGRICSSNFNAGSVYSGAFNSFFNSSPSSVSADIGSRLAKW